MDLNEAKQVAKDVINIESVEAVQADLAKVLTTISSGSSTGKWVLRYTPPVFKTMPPGSYIVPSSMLLQIIMGLKNKADADVILAKKAVEDFNPKTVTAMSEG
jgi:hypothetical protein